MSGPGSSLPRALCQARPETSRIGATVGEATLLDTVSYDRSLNEEVAARGQSRESDPCRRMLLGHAGSHPETTGRSVDEGGLHRRRRRERDVPQPWHARRGDRDRLRPRADLVSRPAGVLLPDPRYDDAAPAGPRRGAALSLGDLLSRRGTAPNRPGHDRRR